MFATWTSLSPILAFSFSCLPYSLLLIVVQIIMTFFLPYLVLPFKQF